MHGSRVSGFLGGQLVQCKNAIRGTWLRQETKLIIVIAKFLFVFSATAKFQPLLYA